MTVLPVDRLKWCRCETCGHQGYAANPHRDPVGFWSEPVRQYCSDHSQNGDVDEDALSSCMVCRRCSSYDLTVLRAPPF